MSKDDLKIYVRLSYAILLPVIALLGIIAFPVILFNNLEEYFME